MQQNDAQIGKIMSTELKYQYQQLFLLSSFQQQTTQSRREHDHIGAKEKQNERKK